MNKELIDRVWKYYLLKEFKEEVKAEYRRTSIMGVKGQYELGILHTYENTFGHHNLTSDAEGGDDEMLYVSRKQVQELYSSYCTERDEEEPGSNRSSLGGRIAMLQELFGSKCLPDEACNVASPSQNSPENCDTEKHISTDCDKPAEPKFKRGDMVIYKWTGKKKVVVGMDKYGRYMIALPNMQSPMHANESDLEPYTDPEEDLIPSNSGELNTQEADNQSRNLSQETANCDKQFDNILKDGFSKERRLNIATTIIGYIIQNGFYSLAEKYREENINNIVKLSMQITDTLIAEAEEGGAK